MESLGQCLEYTKGKVTLTVSLPKGHEGCQYCPFVRFDKYNNYHYCQNTKEPIINPSKFRGDQCPIEWED